MKKLKKILSAILALSVLASAVGVAAHRHECLSCDSKRTFYSLFGFNDTTEHKCCVVGSEESDDCCSTEANEFNSVCDIQDRVDKVETAFTNCCENDYLYFSIMDRVVKDDGKYRIQAPRPIRSIVFIVPVELYYSKLTENLIIIDDFPSEIPRKFLLISLLKHSVNSDEEPSDSPLFA